MERVLEILKNAKFEDVPVALLMVVALLLFIVLLQVFFVED